MTFWMRATLAGALWIAPSIAGAQDSAQHRAVRGAVRMAT